MSKPFAVNPSSRAGRRVFLKCGLGACAAGAFIPGIPARTVMAPYYKVVFDERFEFSRALGAGAAERGMATAAIRGDITKLFFDDLDRRWRQGPVRLAGYTTPASLFCLDLLARDRGMRLSYRVTMPRVEEALGVLDGARPAERCRSNEPALLVFWILAPSDHASKISTDRLPDEAGFLESWQEAPR